MRDRPQADHAVTSLAMALCALAVGYANHVDLVNHRGTALSWLCLGIAFCLAGVARVGPRGAKVLIPAVLSVGLILLAIIDWREANFETSIGAGILFVALTGLIARPRWIVWIMVTAIILIGAITLARTRHFIYIADVRVFQERGSHYLLHGVDPYSGIYPNVYEKGAPFYGPGVVGPDNNLTYGFPYPPLSLLMSTPSYALTHDCRWSDLTAIALSAVLLALARPTRTAIAVAALFLLTPKTLTILTISWTEPLVVLNFSLLMFCACRFRRGLPYALGLFISTKQYAILALPLVPLLDAKEWGKIIAKALAVAVAIHVPFLVWNPAAFWRSVVQWQFIQPFRDDALSFTAWMYLKSGWKLPIWVSLLAIVPAYFEGLKRAARTPAGFAGALALVMLVFFAFNKQAFCNYYYFSIAAAWWAVAAAEV